MCNVPIAIDQSRLFLNSALIKCERKATIQRLISRGVLNLASADLDKPARILVLNTSGVDTIEEVAFARATLYERVYRHAATRNAERMLSVAICDAANADPKWKNVLSCFVSTDNTFTAALERCKSDLACRLASKLLRRDLPKRAFAFSPDFYEPVVPYVSIFSGWNDGEVGFQYYHEVISKDPFHEIVEGLKERSPIFLSGETHRDLENRISLRSHQIAVKLRRSRQTEAPAGSVPAVFFIPLPDNLLCNHNA
jgi:HD superfamily phosphohydrolase